MIVRPQKILIKWCPSNTEHFKNIGYTYSKLFNSFEVDVDDLHKTSRQRVKCICEKCNKTYTLTYGRAREKEEKNSKFECKNCGKWFPKKIDGKKTDKFTYNFDFKMQKSYFDKIKGEDKRINELYPKFLERNYLLFKNQQYLNNREKIKYLCVKHGIKYISWGNFSGGKGCRECGIERGSHLQSHMKTKEQIRREVEELGYIYIKSEDYRSVYSKITITCPIHRIERTISYRALERNSTLCLKCSRENTGIKFMSAERSEQFEEFFTKNNLTLVKPLEYKGVHQTYSYRCCKHPEQLLSSTFNQMIRVKTHCRKCYSESFSGRNSSNWKGNRPLYEYLRGTLDKWKKESMRVCEYKCVVSGEDFDHIHHLFPFNQIVNEVVAILELPGRDCLEQYSEKELSEAKRLSLDLHYQYGLGVCLKEEIHKEFHKQYGNENFDKNDFESFCKKNYDIKIREFKFYKRL